MKDRNHPTECFLELKFLGLTLNRLLGAMVDFVRSQLPNVKVGTTESNRSMSLGFNSNANDHKAAL